MRTIWTLNEKAVKLHRDQLRWTMNTCHGLRAYKKKEQKRHSQSMLPGLRNGCRTQVRIQMSDLVSKSKLGFVDIDLKLDTDGGIGI